MFLSVGKLLMMSSATREKLLKLGACSAGGRS